MIKWLVFIPSVLVLALACGREGSQRDVEIDALRRRNQIQENINSANTRAASLNAKSRAEDRKQKERVKKEFNDDRFRHGVLVVAGPMITNEKTGETDEDKGITIEAQHGKIKSRAIEDSEIKQLSKADFSESVSNQALTEFSLVKSGVRNENLKQALHIGCGDLFKVETPVGEATSIAALSTQAPCFECDKIFPSDEEEKDDDGEVKKTDTKLKATIKAFNVAADKQIIKFYEVLDGEENYSNLGQVLDIGGQQIAIPGIVVKAETVIVCSLSNLSNLKISAINLVFYDLDATMRTESRKADWKHFIAYGETLFLKGSNEITSIGAKDGGGVYQRGPHLRIETKKVFRPSRTQVATSGSAKKFDGNLNIVARGSEGDE